MQETPSHYTVLARRFRPQTFDEVVGQQQVARALQNAIRHGRVAHAYLFTGARGVGKTSMARILAKALNCPNVSDGVPCNACDICRSISTGHDVDIQEIDGASNNGVDHIRALRANVGVKSMRTDYKLYIIDEVHMLSPSAFNALLKTLEEPPPNVKFVFCTTEPNKVPDTILSRCQRFDFASIETAAISTRLGQIAQAEGVEVDPDAAELVARRAGGSMRDSQSLFDQLLAFGGDRITPDDVHRLLGTADDERLIEIAEALIGGQQSTVLQAFNRALTEGIQLEELVDQLLGYLRDLMVLASGADGVGLMSVGRSHREALSRQAERWGLQTIVAALQILAEAKGRMFRAAHARVLAELALIRISLLEDLKPLDRLIGELKAGDGPPQRRVTGTGAGRSKGGGTTAPGPPGDEGAVRSSPTPKKKIPDDDIAGQPHGSQASEDRAEAAARIAFRPGCEESLWAEVVSRIHDMLKDHARAASRIAISGPNQLDVIFPASYHFSKKYCEQPEMTQRLEGLLAELTGQRIRIQFQLAEGQPVTPAEPRVPEKGNGRPERSPEPLDDPFVEQAKTIFGATVVKRT